MHIYFSGIGGTAIGPLALIAKQAGFRVSGSDKQASGYIDYLKKRGITDIHIGQTRQAITQIHEQVPIDWIVHSSAISKENPNHPELVFAHENGIKTSKRDELINLVVKDKKLKMIAIAGTQGKTTTTAMVIWLFKQLGVPISYSVGAKISFGDMGQYQKGSQFFVYEADEFDRNFLAFEPHLSIITGISWDHHEIFPTREDYQQAFQEFISQSDSAFLWLEDLEYLNFNPTNVKVLDSGDQAIEDIKLAGRYNRLNAWLAIQAAHRIAGVPTKKLIKKMGDFPGLQRRMEQIRPNLFSDYAHTPEKIRGGMNIAQEIAAKKGQRIVVVYEPIGNRRQHFVIDNYQDCFGDASHVYWVPTYLVREDPNQHVLTPTELIAKLSDPSIATPAKMDTKLKQTIEGHLKNGDTVVAMSAGGGHSLDEWIRQNFATS